MSASDSMAAFIRWVMRDTTYHKHYTATVQKQLGDTVDLLPDDDAIRGSGLSGVPIMHGLPGVSVEVAPGTKMTLFFANGDPAEPRAALWEGGHISISFADGVMPVSRVGDIANVNPTGLAVVVGSGSSAGTYPVVGTCTATMAGGAPSVKA